MDQQYEVCLTDLARKTALFTFTELKALVKELVLLHYERRQALVTAADNARKSIVPAITLRGYTQRFDLDGVHSASGCGETGKSGGRLPSDEYVLLLYIWLEAFYGPGRGQTLIELNVFPEDREAKRDRTSAQMFGDSDERFSAEEAQAQGVRSR